MLPVVKEIIVSRDINEMHLPANDSYLLTTENLAIGSLLMTVKIIYQYTR